MASSTTPNLCACPTDICHDCAHFNEKYFDEKHIAYDADGNLFEHPCSLAEPGKFYYSPELQEVWCRGWQDKHTQRT